MHTWRRGRGGEGPVIEARNELLWLMETEMKQRSASPDQHYHLECKDSRYSESIRTSIVILPWLQGNTKSHDNLTPPSLQTRRMARKTWAPCE